MMKSKGFKIKLCGTPLNVGSVFNFITSDSTIWVLLNRESVNHVYSWSGIPKESSFREI